jgi:PPOX class probable F420-dependent enzyme
MSIGERLAATSNRFYLRIRDKRAWDLADGEAGASDFSGLDGHKYALLITYKKSGEAIPTPVWFGVGDDGNAYVRSERQVGKVKRIRANGRARLAPSTMRGKPLGPAADGVARVLGEAEWPRAEAALASNYGLGRKVYESQGERLGIDTVYLEIAPAGTGGEA